MRTYRFQAVMAVVLALTGFSGSALANESFEVSGTGNIGSQYEINVTIDGDSATFVNPNNTDMTPEEFVARWKDLWDTLYPGLANKFVDHGDGTFKLIGGAISVEVGDIDDTQEVVGDSDGVPFNPVLRWKAQGIPTVSEWAAIVMTLLLLVAGTIVFVGKRERGPVAA